MTIRPGLEKRLAWMADHIYVGYRCGTCLLKGVQCVNCANSELKANGGMTKKEFEKHSNKAIKNGFKYPEDYLKKE